MRSSARRGHAQCTPNGIYIYQIGQFQSCRGLGSKSMGLIGAGVVEETQTTGEGTRPLKLRR